MYLKNTLIDFFEGSDSSWQVAHISYRAVLPSGFFSLGIDYPLEQGDLADGTG